jgi:glycosyltransferase involved in cell wall biosynthesis
MPGRRASGDLDPGGRRLGGRLKIVHPGIEIERFDSDGRAPSAPPEVLVLGAITDWKRPDVALDAHSLVRRVRPDVRLRLAGAPLENIGNRLLAELRSRASQPELAGSVELAGAVTDPGAELARSTCLLHCATREPFGLAVLEALAAGRPAIVPAACGPAEIVDHSCGRLYPPGDARAAAEAIPVSNLDRAAEMRAAGRSARTNSVQSREGARPSTRRRSSPSAGGVVSPPWLRARSRWSR